MTRVLKDYFNTLFNYCTKATLWLVKAEYQNSKNSARHFFRTLNISRVSSKHPQNGIKKLHTLQTETKIVLFFVADHVIFQRDF